MAAWLGAGALGAGAVVAGQALGGGNVPSRTHFVVDPADLARLRQVRVAAAAAIAEMRGGLADAELRQQIYDKMDPLSGG
jgi:hypothetical protein